MRKCALLVIDIKLYKVVQVSMIIVIIEYSKTVTLLHGRVHEADGISGLNPVVDFDNVWATDHVKSTGEFTFRTVVSPKMIEMGVLEGKLNRVLSRWVVNIKA